MYWKTMFEIPIIKHSVGIVATTRKGFSFKLLIVKTPNAKTLGMTSYCKNGHHVLFFDFDGNNLNEVVFQLRILQAEYGLSQFYLFENDTENSFHAVCLDKLPLSEAIEIIHQTTADASFKYAPLRYAMKKWVLRVDSKGEREKPKYLFQLVPLDTGERNKSNPHRMFLNLNYKMKIKKDRLFDNENKMDFFKYYTANRIR